MFFFSCPACPMLAISSISPHPALAILSGAYSYILCQISAPSPSSHVSDARFLCQQCTVYPVIFPWLFCHFAEQTHMHPRGALLAASPSRSRRASVADAISFVAVHSAVPNKAPLIDFLLLISNFRSSSSPRLFASIITIFSHSNSGAFKLFTKVIERNNSWVGRNAVPSCFII